MFEGYKTLVCFLAVVSLAMCYCPNEKIHGLGDCSYRISCIGTISDIKLPPMCLEAINYRNTVQVNLNEAIERLDNDNIDTQFLNIITHLRISANWQETTLTILKYTSLLQSLQLVGIGLQKISAKPFYHLQYIESIDLSHNKLRDIGELFQFESYPNKLRNLSLAYNSIDEIASYAFEELSSLTELDLSYNSISDLTEEPFQNLTNLKILRLNNNRIRDLNGAVNNLRNLKHLFVRGNQIQNISDESLQIIEHLETFDVSSNELELIKPVFFSRHWDHFGNHSHCRIILSENHITEIPNGPDFEISSRFFTKHLVDLYTEINLSVNSIGHIEYNAFQSLIRVVSLDLSNNKIKDFIVNARDLAYLEYLNMSGNYITHLYYESFSLMNNLQNLDLSYNRLDFIPDMAFNNNYNLKLVNMTFNGLENLERIHIKMFHPEGGVLDLSNNGLYKLVVPNGEGIRLVTLLLHSNNISDPSLINLSQQTELLTLDMSQNSIWELDTSSLNLPESLTLLDLSCNKIESIGPSTFYQLNHLRTLRLNHNQLTQLQFGMFQNLNELQNLDLSYNRIGNLDSKYLTDLKSLRLLSVRSNDMHSLDYKGWYGHKYEILTYVDNNDLSCEWVGKALHDFNNEYSRMRPTVLAKNRALHSVEDIPCVADVSAASTDVKSQYVMEDERLLMTSQKILEAVRLQNNYLWKFMRHILREESKKESRNL